MSQKRDAKSSVAKKGSRATTTRIDSVLSEELLTQPAAAMTVPIGGESSALYAWSAEQRKSRVAPA